MSDIDLVQATADVPLGTHTADTITQAMIMIELSREDDDPPAAGPTPWGRFFPPPGPLPRGRSSALYGVSGTPKKVISHFAKFGGLFWKSSM